MLCLCVLALIGLMASQVASQTDCYEGCRCLTASKGIHCASVAQVPRRTLPGDYAAISFCQDRPFNSTALYRANMTGLVTLERISMCRCGLETVEPGAFSSIKNLKSLDLSQNQLHTIEPFTFRSLTLETLYLGSNYQLQLDEYSFADLQVQHLKLENNGLRQLDVDVFLSLRKASLRSLTLHSNKLTYISPELKDFIQSLQRVELHNNSYVCDCSMKWFIDLYQARRQQGSDLFGNVAKMELSCGAGPLNGRAFVNLSTANELQCHLPVVTDVRIDMTQDKWILMCAFEGNPMPTAVIKAQNADAVVPNQFVRRQNASVAPQKRIEVTLPIDGLDNTTGAYRCEAHNEIGNASLAVDLSLPRVFYRALAIRNEVDAAAAAAAESDAEPESSASDEPKADVSQTAASATRETSTAAQQVNTNGTSSAHENENEREADEFESLFEKFGEMKRVASSLKGDERLEYAERMTTMFWNALGLQADRHDSASHSDSDHDSD